MNKRLSVDERREIFNVLVQTQDEIANVAESRRLVSQEFGITELQLRQIEEEGLEHQWPPLD